MLRSQSAVAQAESASPVLAKGTISLRDLSRRMLVRATGETDGANTQAGHLHVDQIDVSFVTRVSLIEEMMRYWYFF